MNLVRMAYSGCFVLNRFGLLKKRNDSYKRWGDGFWDDIGYWKACDRKGYDATDRKGSLI